jgi:hypothetical protein
MMRNRHGDAVFYFLSLLWLWHVSSASWWVFFGILMMGLLVNYAQSTYQRVQNIKLLAEVKRLQQEGAGGNDQ